jgi:hypothetical protein
MHERNNNQMQENSYDEGVGGADVRKPNEFLRDLELSATDESKNQIWKAPLSYQAPNGYLDQLSLLTPSSKCHFLEILGMNELEHYGNVIRLRSRRRRLKAAR